MKNKIFSILATLIFFFTVFFTVIYSSNKAYAHENLKIGHKAHKPIFCILDEDRSKVQTMVCEYTRNRHRLCKLDEHCAILKMEELEKEGEEMKEILENLKLQLQGTATCGDLIFNHRANKKTSIYLEPDNTSKEIAVIEKNKDLLFISPSTKKKNWYFVKIKKGKTCADGFIQQEFVVKKGGVDTVVKVGPKLIEIIYPDWEEEDKLIFVDAEGSVSITGAVQEGKIDQIIINDEEEIINSDNTFDFVMHVPSNGAKVRIIGYKNGKKVKELIFKVKVGK